MPLTRTLREAYKFVIADGRFGASDEHFGRPMANKAACAIALCRTIISSGIGNRNAAVRYG